MRNIFVESYSTEWPARYAELKVQLANQYPNDIEQYIAGKAPLIEEILEQAEQWRAKNAG